MFPSLFVFCEGVECIRIDVYPLVINVNITSTDGRRAGDCPEL